MHIFKTFGAIDGKQSLGDPKDKNKIYSATISEGDIVDMGWGFRLKMNFSNENTNLQRMKDFGTVLFNHDRDRPIGRAEDVRIEDGKLLADFVISETEKDIQQKIEDGTLSAVSGGYILDENHIKQEKDDIGNYYVSNKQEVLEFSVVSIPADSKAMITKQQLEDFKQSIPKESEVQMENKSETVNQTVDVSATERKRIDDIFARADKASTLSNVQQMAREAIQKGSSGDEFGQKLLDEMVKQEGANKVNIVKQVGDKKEAYSMSRLFRAAAAGDSCMETEISQEFGNTGGRYSIPYGYVTQAVTKSGEGVDLIAEDYRADRFIDTLKDNSVAMKVGVQTMTGLKGTVKVPRSTNEATTTMKASGSDTGDTNLTFDHAAISKKTGSGGVEIDRDLLLEATVDLESVVRNKFNYSVSSLIDDQVLQGTGSGNNNLGITGSSDTTKVVVIASTGSAGATNLNRAKALAFVSAIATENADIDNAKWVMGYKRIVQGMSLAIDAGSGKFLIGDDMRMLNFPIFSRNKLDDTIIFGDFSQMFVGFFGDAITFDVDTTTKRASGATIFRWFVDFGTAIAQPKALAYSAVS